MCVCGGTLFGGTHAASSRSGSKSSGGSRPLSNGKSCFGVVQCKSTKSIGCSGVLAGARILAAALCINSHHRNSRPSALAVA